ncbi:MAG: Phosphate regulon transcriptional regulatory protein PhoB (SphR) [uncultured Acidimicrobiales bacterium]|uniref:Phosphate regulon transcriptional regulatory protein PhoB (SphR) n=1 Tax=uncultured Acidimicrobiales bacterium TaxID=310071 RepID=A0A6J4HXT0_9ACTN|nr:MAG: Phosphate regulon transcriptional regulatory protein PhoB (SphR) [uncultured Acidimicrobiales bacterium]
MPTQVLLVEDDASLREVIGTVLTAIGCRVDSVGNGLDALARFPEAPYGLVILDLMLPGMDGFSVCREMRKTSTVPIIMLTARRDTADVVTGLELGADDYVTKPFEAAELIARVRAALRRSAAGEHQKLTAGELTIDVPAFRATKLGHELSLSATEFKLLAELTVHAGQVLSREQLLRRVWGYDYLGDSRLVDMAVKRLRDKIEDDPSSPQYVATVRGVGYRFEGDVVRA